MNKSWNWLMVLRQSSLIHFSDQWKKFKFNKMKLKKTRLQFFQVNEKKIKVDIYLKLFFPNFFQNLYWHTNQLTKLKMMDMQRMKKKLLKISWKKKLLFELNVQQIVVLLRIRSNRALATLANHEMLAKLEMLKNLAQEAMHAIVQKVELLLPNERILVDATERFHLAIECFVF